MPVPRGTYQGSIALDCDGIHIHGESEQELDCFCVATLFTERLLLQRRLQEEIKYLSSKSQGCAVKHVLDRSICVIFFKQQLHNPKVSHLRSQNKRRESVMILYIRVGPLVEAEFNDALMKYSVIHRNLACPYLESAECSNNKRCVPLGGLTINGHVLFQQQADDIGVPVHCGIM